jgi:hypothetical protein
MEGNMGIETGAGVALLILLCALIDRLRRGK